MEITVVWSDSAIMELQSVFDYLLTTANFKVAQKIVNSITDKSLILSENPRIGQIEELLKHRKDEIRYLVEGKYKIVYKIEESIVVIVTLFDCRQNPKRLSRKGI
jgi:toxin ParE1/3/4